LKVSIIIPVFNKIEFTRLCLDRIGRHTGDVDYEVVIVDNASSDGTEAWFSTAAALLPVPLRYHRNAENLGFARANNIGAGLATGEYLLFLNNDTLVQPRWLSDMVTIAADDPRVGVVGIKQLFPYTSVIYHTGIVFVGDGSPQHLYPHLDASLPYVNKQREYQAVTGACLLISAALFRECGGFDEAYVNGYEDIDLCMSVTKRGRTIVCCTSAFIYHYGQISEGRTAADDRNAQLFATKWANEIRVDQHDYLARDAADRARTPARPARPLPARLPPDAIYLADDLGVGSALTWINAELALSLSERGVPVRIRGSHLSSTVAAATRRRLQPLMTQDSCIGGVQLKWSHYRKEHLDLELSGDIDLEVFVINYVFGRPGDEPWDYWLQCLRQNHRHKLPDSEFCQSVLRQIGIQADAMHVVHHGYSREIPDVEPPRRRDDRFRLLTVTNSHDLNRYNTDAIISAFDAAFVDADPVSLVIKDYGATSGDTTIRQRLASRGGRARIEYVADFTDKRELIGLYKSCDAFVSAHRGEGFGMKILDAAACGLPVISPLFGGPTAFLREDNSFPVAFAMVPMGDCLDTRSLHITNQPMWAEVDPGSLRDQMRRVWHDRTSAAAIAAAGRTTAVENFSWDRVADRFLAVVKELRERRESIPRPSLAPKAPAAERSPYWLGVRVSVVVPTHNRKDKLLACLRALERQSVLPQEFEVLVIDDGSTDGTQEAVQSAVFPFPLRYFRQEPSGPGAARNLAIGKAVGELVLFIGDDIYADEHLLEAHLMAHAAGADPGLAVLGRIDWPSTMTPNAVMDYVCGDAMLQFAYTYIPKAPALDHRFFYTSNISLKREFLVDAAHDGVRFDADFRYAAFEDSEFALRLQPRGLQIRYAPEAVAVHDHWMDLDSFAARERHAGAMAVVFYRKHPGADDQLRVRWVAEMVEPAARLLDEPDLLPHLEAFDRQSDDLLRSLARSLEGLMAIDSGPAAAGLSVDRLRASLHNLFGVLFDVERTRGKIDEWFSMVDDARVAKAAQALACVLRKIEFLSVGADSFGPLTGAARVDSRTLEGLSRRLAQIEGLPQAAASRLDRSAGRGVRQRLRRAIMTPAVIARALEADRFIQARLEASQRTAWLTGYRRVRRRLRDLV